MTQSQLTNREHARMGQIFDINKAVSKNIYTSLQKSKMSAIPVAYFNKAIKVDTYFNQQHDYSNSQLEEISSRSNAQYVLLSQITSLSTSDKLNSDYAFWQDESYQRHYQIEFSLFNGTTYEPLWQQSYQSQAIWPFEKTTINVYKEDFLVAVSADNALAVNKKVALQDLQGSNLLMLSDGHCFKDQAQQFCFSAGVDVSSQYQGNSLETLLALVAMDDGVTFVPKLAAIPREGIHYLPIFPNQQRNIVLACRKHYPHLSGVEQLADWLSAHDNLKVKLTQVL